MISLVLFFRKPGVTADEYNHRADGEHPEYPVEEVEMENDVEGAAAAIDVDADGDGSQSQPIDVEAGGGSQSQSLNTHGVLPGYLKIGDDGCCRSMWRCSPASKTGIKQQERLSMHLRTKH
jgi:hypothetical protein